jgi:hypothetical protein
MGIIGATRKSVELDGYVASILHWSQAHMYSKCSENCE